jgi:nucleoside-diphosphate-sugar epimerase
LLDHGRPGDSYVVAEDEPVSVIAFHETLAALVGRGRVERRSREHFAVTRDADWFEVATTSQPVDASAFKQRTGWAARERFVTSVGRFLR